MNIKTAAFSIMFAALWLPLSISAETVNVTDAWKFEMRESPCFQCKIARLGIDSGTQLETLDTEGSWTQVRMQNGTVGWMPNNYLSRVPAARNELDNAQKSAEIAVSKAELASQQMAKVTEEIRRAGIQIEMVEISSDDGLATIQAPKIIGNLATLGSQNMELHERSQLLQNELDLRIAEIDRLKGSEIKTFFMYGAGAVIAGAFLAVVLPRLKPRRSSSEWA